MKCPACGANARRQDAVCAHCGQALPRRVKRTPAMAVANACIWTLCILVSVAVLGLVFYKLYFWIDALRMERLYDSGDALAPEVEAITLDDGSVGHAITFFGNDGDTVFLEELRRSYPLVGGVARIEIPDSRWFDADPETLDAAVITLTPIVHTEKGDQQTLPTMELTIDTPTSPLTLIDPETPRKQVYTSTYPLQVQVVPGSEVLVAGEDVSDVVNYQGYLTVNVNVYPQGDNLISLLVRTPNHKETRADINLYRDVQAINLEPSLNLEKKSTRQNFTVTGQVDPTATFSVDTPHVDGSITVDDKGNFRFLAKLETVGDNTITFRASKEGVEDSVVSVVVYYVPTLDVYSRTAWKMDYDQLKLLYETWMGRVFLCEGTVVEILTDGEVQKVVMDVTTDDTPRPLILFNYSSVGTPAVGAKYRAYADVTGSEFYNNVYCPTLACRYMSLVD